MYRPKAEIDFPIFYQGYVNQVEVDAPFFNLLDQIHQGFINELESLKNIDFSKAYADDKWTIAQVIRHCIDTERVFAYRAFCISREKNAIVKSFDENEYANNAGLLHNKTNLLDEFLHVRNSTRLLYNSLSNVSGDKFATFENGNKISLKAMAYIIAGHWLHHKNILNERYFVRF